MANVIDVAKYFISLSRESSLYAITPLKLQKLLYYAQGFYLVENEDPLFNGNLLAWDHGPVNRIIYDKYRTYKHHPIPNEPFQGEMSDEEIAAILKTWNEFGHLNGKTLEELTHQEDPWLFTAKNEIINIDLIKDYFRENYNI